MRIASVCLLFAILAVQSVHAQPFQVQGVVTNDSGGPLERARIALVDPDGLTLGVAFSDAEGRYDLLVSSVSNEPDLPVPTSYWVGPIAPNPLPASNRTVVVPFTVPQNRPEAATVEVFDVLGRRVSTDRTLSAGLYIYRLQFEQGYVTPGRSFVLAGPARLRFEASQRLGDPTLAPNPRAASSAAVLTDLVIEKAGFVTDARVLDLDDGDVVTADAALAVAPAPTAAFEVGGTLEAGAVVQFDAGSSAPPEGGTLATYAWAFGDGQRGGGAEAAHLFTEPGTYTVTLTVATEFGAMASATRAVTIAEPPPPAAMDGVVTGLVTGPDGLPLPDATVRVLRTESVAATDFLGAFTLTGLPVGVPLTVDVRLDGYASQQLAVTILASGEAPAIEATLVRRGAAVRLPAAELGGRADGDEGAMVVLPVDGLVHADGTPATGPVDVQITPVDVTDGMEVGGFPGPFAGVTPEGPAELIVSYGTAEYVFSQDGEELDLAPGTSAVIEIPVYVGRHLDGTEVALGDELPLWSFNEQSAQWVMEAMGTVVVAEASPTGFALRGEVTHFSWWNIDVAPNPAFPNPIPVSPPEDPNDPDDTPEPCENPEGWCASGGATGINVDLCAAGMRGICTDMGFPPPPPPDPNTDPDGNPEPPYGDFDGDGDPWDDDDWDTFCEDNPFCDDFCDSIADSCTGGTITGTPQSGPGGTPPVGGPRNTTVPAGGVPGGLPSPPGVPMNYGAIANNGTSRGSRTTTIPAGQSRTVLIPMTPVGRIGGGLLACDTAPLGTIDPIGEVDVWTFSGQASDYVELEIEAGQASTLEGTVRVLDPSGAEVVSSAFGPNNAAPGFFQLPASGTYRVTVDGTRNEPGAYTVSFGCYEGIQIDQEVTRTLVAGVPRLFAFEGQAGDLVNLAHLGTSLSGGIFARVETAAGQFVRQTGQTALFSETRVFALPFDGVYRIRVEGNAQTPVSGDFILGLPEIEAPTPVTLQQAVTELRGAVSVLGDRQYYTFPASAQDIQNVVFDHPSGGLVAQAFLRRPGTQPFYQRAPVTSTQTTTSTRLAETRPVVLPIDGDYVVEVGTYAVSGGVRTTHTGDYRVRLFAPTPLALSRDTERTGTLSARAFDVYRFSGQAGDLVNVATLGEGVSGGSRWWSGWR
ncbi:MAG: PKD domain-containing protein [Bacteroidota bacterium]